ncbi:unnamed protein product, partial [Symbiodinium pilosum]
GELNALQLEFDQTGAGPIVAAHLGGAAAAPPAVAAVGPVLTPVAGFVWVVAVAEGSGGWPPSWVKGVVGLSDGSVIFVENIANHALDGYISATQAGGPPLPPVPAPPVGAAGALAMGVGDDARTLAVRYGTDGKRRRELRDGIELASESIWADWPIKGPRTAKWVGQYFVSNGGSPMSMHNTWKVNCKLQPSDAGVLEHESICKALELAVEYDQLNIGELATIELLSRRLQMIQFRWKERILGSASSGTVDDESHFFLGVDPTRGNLCICPALNTWLGEELHKEAQANKEQRKAREERALLRGNKTKLAADAWVREGVQTLNSLYGGSEAGIFAPVSSQASALSGLAQKYRLAGPPPQSRPEEALQALLGSMSVYSLDNVECNIASYDEALVSWPEPGSRPVRIAEHLAPDVGKLLSLANAHELLADPAALSGCELVRPYVDPVLLHSPVHMGRFVGRLFKSRMLQFVPGKLDHTVGVFFVRKKSGKLRLILDTRRANNFFVKPRSSQLPTPAAWCSIEVDECDTLYTAAGDVADAFHRMELPPHLRRFFRLPAIKCRFLDKSAWPSGCGPEDYVTPEYATLPMGWNWSLYFCQQLLESAASHANLADVNRIEDRTWTGHVAGDRVVRAQYVDNFFVSGTILL